MFAGMITIYILHGRPTRSVRISFGYMSNLEDARKFMNFIVSSFVSLPSQSGHVYPLRSRSIPPPAEGLEREASGCHLRSIAIYPIKSCAGFRVQSWPLSSTGLLHDREWVLKSRSGEILTQKKVNRSSLLLRWLTNYLHRPAQIASELFN